MRVSPGLPADRTNTMRRTWARGLPEGYVGWTSLVARELRSCSIGSRPTARRLAARPARGHCPFTATPRRRNCPSLPRSRSRSVLPLRAAAPYRAAMSGIAARARGLRAAALRGAFDARDRPRRWCSRQRFKHSVFRAVRKCARRSRPSQRFRRGARTPITMCHPPDARASYTAKTLARIEEPLSSAILSGELEASPHAAAVPAEAVPERGPRLRAQVWEGSGRACGPQAPTVRASLDPDCAGGIVLMAFRWAAHCAPAPPERLVVAARARAIRSSRWEST